MKGAQNLRRVKLTSALATLARELIREQKAKDDARDTTARAREDREAFDTKSGGATAKEQDRLYALAEARTQQQSRSAAKLDKQSEKTGAAIAKFKAFVVAGDPIVAMAPGGDVLAAVKDTPAGKFGFLKRAIMDSSLTTRPASKDRVEALGVVQQALENYHQALMHYYLNNPAEACRMDPAKPNLDNPALKDAAEFLRNAVRNSYTKLNLEMLETGFKFSSRTEKFLLEMGEKLGISAELKAIADSIRKPDEKAVVVVSPSDSSTSSGHSRKHTPGEGA